MFGAPVSLLGECPGDEDCGDQDGECHDLSVCQISAAWPRQTGLLLSSYPHYLIITIIWEVGVDRVTTGDLNE